MGTTPKVAVTDAEIVKEIMGRSLKSSAIEAFW